MIARLREIVAAAELSPGGVVLAIGTGAGVLIPLIRSYRPSTVLACDVAEKMLQHLRDRHPGVRTLHSDIASLDLASTGVDAIFMNGKCTATSQTSPLYAAMRHACLAGRTSWGQPSRSRAFVDQLRESSDLLIESFPAREEFEAVLGPVGLEVIAYRDEPKLYLMVARKS